MNWQAVYNSRKCSAKEAVQLIKSGDRVVLAHCIAEPQALVKAMVDNAEAYRNVEICNMLSFGSGKYCDKDLKDNFQYNAIFASSNSRQSITVGNGDYTPVFFHELPGYFRKKIIPIDVFMVQVSPPDRNGFCCTGFSSDFTMQGIRSAKLVLAQVNDQIPVTYGDTHIHVSKIDRFVEESEPLIEIPLAKTNDVAIKISEYCVGLIEDGSTLQIGIGAIPDEIVRGLIGKKDLGIHSELITDALLDLYESGAITNEAKSQDRGKIVLTFLFGTKRLYDFVANNPAIEFRTVDYTNHPSIIAQCSKMVSINAGLEVDFMGQVVSDSIGTNQYSGVGGQVDFVRGTSMSLDGKGKSIIVMPSTARKKDGTLISKIKPYITHGAAVTTSRNDVDTIITEYGIAKLKGKTLKQRARDLINIANPIFKEELISEFERRFNVGF